MRRRELLTALGTVALSSGPVRVEQSGTGTAPRPPSDTGSDPTDPADDDGGTTPPAGGGTPPDAADTTFWDPGRFDRTVDVVSDLDCSPDGDEPCGEALSAALGERTLFRFPPGEYRFEDNFTVRGAGRVGFVGSPDGEVRLLPPEGFNSQLFDLARVGQVGLGNVTVDVTAPNTTAGLRIITEDGFMVENVTFRGRGTYPAQQVTHAFFLAVENPDAEGVLRNVVARKGSAIGHYKSGGGRGAVWIGPAHHGTAYIEDCGFAEFGNNALYTSRNPGNVRVHGGTFRNNNVCGVRLSGAGSYVRGARVVVDTSEYSGPRTGLDSAFKTRGIVVEQGPFDEAPGVVVRDSTVAIERTPNPGPALAVWPTGKSVRVVDSTLRANGDTSVVHRRPEEQQGAHAPSRRDRWVELDGVDVQGRPSGRPMVALEDAPKSVLRGCRVRRGGGNSDGVELVRSPGTLFDGGTIAAGRYPVKFDAVGSASETCLLLVGRFPALRTDLDAGEISWAPLATRIPYRPVDGLLDGRTLPVFDACLTEGALGPLAGADWVGMLRIRDERVALHAPRSSA